MNNRHRAGQPAQIQFAGSEPEEHQATSTEEKGDLNWFAYLLIAAMLTCSAIGIGFIAGRYFS